VKVLTESGVRLEVSFNGHSNRLSDIWLSGEAQVLFEGEVPLELVG
jgi:hypothetical protein